MSARACPAVKYRSSSEGVFELSGLSFGRGGCKRDEKMAIVQKICQNCADRCSQTMPITLNFL
jgi:hypothetical protein